MNAVTAVAGILRRSVNWNIYSIGHTTAALITQLFQKPIAGTATDAAALADVILNDGVREVVFFCGNIRRDVLPEKLRNANILVEEIVVYETKEIPHAISRQYDAILFYSPSAVHSFFSTNTISNGTVLFAIGNTTADAIKHYSNNQVHIAAKPGKEDMVRELMQHINTQKTKLNERPKE
jgi:uroporphyrinogen-III synthase